jgi:hypothetical protein
MTGVESRYFLRINGHPLRRKLEQLSRPRGVKTLRAGFNLTVSQPVVTPADVEL